MFFLTVSGSFLLSITIIAKGLLETPLLAAFLLRVFLLPLLPRELEVLAFPPFGFLPISPL